MATSLYSRNGSRLDLTDPRKQMGSYIAVETHVVRSLLFAARGRGGEGRGGRGRRLRVDVGYHCKALFSPRGHSDCLNARLNRLRCDLHSAPKNEGDISFAEDVAVLLKSYFESYFDGSTREKRTGLSCLMGGVKEGHQPSHDGIKRHDGIA